MKTGKIDFDRNSIKTLKNIEKEEKVIISGLKGVASREIKELLKREGKLHLPLLKTGETRDVSHLKDQNTTRNRGNSPSLPTDLNSLKILAEKLTKKTKEKIKSRKKKDLPERIFSVSPVFEKEMNGEAIPTSRQEAENLLSWFRFMKTKYELNDEFDIVILISEKEVAKQVKGHCKHLGLLLKSILTYYRKKIEKTSSKYEQQIDFLKLSHDGKVNKMTASQNEISGKYENKVKECHNVLEKHKLIIKDLQDDLNFYKSKLNEMQRLYLTEQEIWKERNMAILRESLKNQVSITHDSYKLALTRLRTDLFKEDNEANSDIPEAIRLKIQNGEVLTAEELSAYKEIYYKAEEKHFKLTQNAETQTISDVESIEKTFLRTDTIDQIGLNIENTAKVLQNLFHQRHFDKEVQADIDIIVDGPALKDIEEFLKNEENFGLVFADLAKSAENSFDSVNEKDLNKVSEKEILIQNSFKTQKAESLKIKEETGAGLAYIRSETEDVGEKLFEGLVPDAKCLEAEENNLLVQINFSQSTPEELKSQNLLRKMNTEISEIDEEELKDNINKRPSLKTLSLSKPRPNPVSNSTDRLSQKRLNKNQHYSPDLKKQVISRTSLRKQSKKDLDFMENTAKSPKLKDIKKGKTGNRKTSDKQDLDLSVSSQNKPEHRQSFSLNKKIQSELLQHLISGKLGPALQKSSQVLTVSIQDKKKELDSINTEITQKRKILATINNHIGVNEKRKQTSKQEKSFSSPSSGSESENNLTEQVSLNYDKIDEKNIENIKVPLGLDEDTWKTGYVVGYSDGKVIGFSKGKEFASEEYYMEGYAQAAREINEEEEVQIREDEVSPKYRTGKKSRMLEVRPQKDSTKTSEFHFYNKKSAKKSVTSFNDSLNGIFKKVQDYLKKRSKMSRKMLYRMMSSFYESAYNALVSEGSVDILMVCYEEIAHRYGLKKVSDRKFLEFITDVIRNKELKRCIMFLKVVDLKSLVDLEMYSKYTISLYLECFNYMMNSKIGLMINLDDTDDKVFLPVVRAVECAREKLDSKVDKAVISYVVNIIEHRSIPDPRKINTALVELELVLEALCDSYEMIQQRMKSSVKKILTRFIQNDLVPNYVFRIVMRTVSPSKISKIEEMAGRVDLTLEEIFDICVKLNVFSESDLSLLSKGSKNVFESYGELLNILATMDRKENMWISFPIEEWKALLETCKNSGDSGETPVILWQVYENELKRIYSELNSKI